MMIALLIAAIGAILAGFLAILFGIPVKEFSFGNTLIMAGAMAISTGLVLLVQLLVLRELKNIVRRLAPRTPAETRPRAVLAPVNPPAAPARAAAGDEAFPFPRDWSAEPGGGEPSSARLPWRDEAGTPDRTRDEAAAEPVHVDPAPQPPPKPRRNLLFSSSLRRERERAQGRAEPSASDRSASPSAESDEAPPAAFADTWPKAGRSRSGEAPPPRRAGRAPSTFHEPNAGPSAAPAEGDDQPAVTVVKSGVVDGMAYSLYSDGSIEAQMPEGMMRFASIDELRAHLDQR